MKGKISIREYLTILQKEWVQFFWASNVYPPKYQGKYKELMADRKLKIIDITRKIMVSNIFDDITALEQVFDSIFNGGNKPNFLYRNAETSDKIHHFNMVYFYVNSYVEFEDKHYIVKSISPELTHVILGTLGDSFTVELESVTHIFEFENFTKWL